jgi:hypothetical protein
MQGRAFTGFSEALSDVNRTVLFEASPGRTGLQSIGQLMHAPLFRSAPPGTSFANADALITQRYRYTKYDDLSPVYAIGNSLAHPKILSLTEKFSDNIHVENFFDYETVRYDDSYLLNEALWDRYFLSSLPAGSDPVPTNPRLMPIPSMPLVPGYETAASGLLVDGAFNVNSTSVEAWVAFLSSFLGKDVALQDGSSDETGDDNSPFLRIGQPVGGAASMSSSPVEARTTYDGYRRLDAEDIRKLATEMVRQVRLRGPFMSLADFVNRSLDAADPEELQLRGALAEALRRSGVNEELEVHPASPSGIPTWNADAEAGPRAENVPGWLSQADLLARLGNAISSRSDTFRIRAYGDKRAPNGDIRASARCEAIVQRLPEFVDPSDLPDEAAADLNPTNTTLGRRFRIVAFRWMTEDEL